MVLKISGSLFVIDFFTRESDGLPLKGDFSSVMFTGVIILSSCSDGMVLIGTNGPLSLNSSGEREGEVCSGQPEPLMTA